MSHLPLLKMVIARYAEGGGFKVISQQITLITSTGAGQGPCSFEFDIRSSAKFNFV